MHGKVIKLFHLGLVLITLHYCIIAHRPCGKIRTDQMNHRLHLKLKRTTGVTCSHNIMNDTKFSDKNKGDRAVLAGWLSGRHLLFVHTVGILWSSKIINSLHGLYVRKHPSYIHSIFYSSSLVYRTVHCTCTQHL